MLIITITMSGEEAPTQQQEEPEQQVKKAEEPQEEEPKSEPESPKQQEEEVEENPLSSRALVLTGYGGYEKIKLQLRTVKPLQLRSGEVLVRVKACGLNFAELLGKQGLHELLPAPPVIMGMEGSGVVEAVAGDVKDRKVSALVMRHPQEKNSSGLQLVRKGCLHIIKKWTLFLIHTCFSSQHSPTWP